MLTLQPRHLRQLHPRNPVKFRARLKARFVGVRLFVPQGRGRRRVGTHVHPAFKLSQRLRRRCVAFGEEGLIVPPRRQGLSQRKQMSARQSPTRLRAF